MSINSSKIYNCVLTKGVLRCRERIQNADLQYDTKFPLFIPKGKFAVLLIRAALKNVKRNGLKETIKVHAIGFQKHELLPVYISSNRRLLYLKTLLDSSWSR